MNRVCFIKKEKSHEANQHASSIRHSKNKQARMSQKPVIFTWAILLLLGSFGLHAQPKVVAYVPNWIDLNSFSNTIDYSKLTHINIAFENPTDANGNLSFNGANATLIQKAHASNVKVFVSLGGASASTDATIQGRYFSLISDSKRAGFIQKILSYVNFYGFDGVDVDLEGPAINRDYGKFISDLVNALHPAGKQVSAALSQGYGGGNVPNATIPLFDFINIMSYDGTGPWDPSTPGQHASYTMAVNDINYWVGRGLQKSKAILGVPFYGYGFGAAFRNNSYAYSEIVNAYTGAENYDQIGSTIYYNGIPTIKAKTTLALQQAGGIMIWELSNDVTGAKSLLLAIDKVIKGNAAIPAVPSGLIVSSALSTVITIKWTDNSNNESLFRIQRSLNGNTWSDLTTVASNTVSYTNTGLSPSTMYYYRVRSENSVGSSSYSNTVSATTPATNPLNLALNKAVTVSSTEAGANVSSFAVDGNTATRWSSTYSDPQWIYVDLGATYNINRVKLNWEVAFARAYQIQTSTNASAWTSIYSTTSGTKGINDLTVSGTGRYIRIYGTTRGTIYGYSLWEIEVYGSATTDSQAPTAPSKLTSPEQTNTTIALSWSASADNVAVTGYDVYNSNVYVASSATTSYTVSSLIAGTSYTFTVKAKDAAGNYSAASNALTVSTKTAPATTNLALNKSSRASSLEDATFPASLAFDGNTATRWASLEGIDPQWIYVDLGANYSITRVKLIWEAAYAKSYKIQVSTNASNWADVYSTSTGDGATDDISFTAVNGRFVRIYGTTRGTTFGYSLFEFEVGGTALKSVTENQIAPTFTIEVYPNPTNELITISLPAMKENGTCKIFSTSGASVYNTPLTKGTSSLSVDLSLWKAGVYIIIIEDNHTKASKKLIVQ